MHARSLYLDNAVNLLQGHRPVRMVTPTFLIHGHEEKSFDAVAASRRWRIQTGRKLRGLSFEQQQALLQRTTETFFATKADAFVAAKPSRRVPAHR